MITIIFGGNGKGKTSLMAYFLNESAFDDVRLCKARAELKKVNKMFNLNIPEPKHFTYADGKDKYKFQKFGYSSRYNIELFPRKLGIQSEAPEGTECQFILPYATLGIDEAQTYFPSRDGDVQPHQFSFFEKHRHNNLNIYMATTRAKLIDVRIRDLAVGMYIKDRTIKRNKYGTKNITWTVDYIDIGNWESYLNAPIDEKSKYSEEKKFTCDYDIYNIYDPESCKELFYTGYQIGG